MFAEARGMPTPHPPRCPESSKHKGLALTSVHAWRPAHVVASMSRAGCILLSFHIGKYVLALDDILYFHWLCG